MTTRPTITKGEPTIYPSKFNKPTPPSTASEIVVNETYIEKHYLAPCDVSQTQVETEIKHLNDKIKTIYSLLGLLESRLSPILRDDTIGEDKGRPIPCLVPLAASLLSSNIDLEISIDKINSIISRIEV